MQTVFSFLKILLICRHHIYFGISDCLLNNAKTGIIDFILPLLVVVGKLLQNKGKLV